MNTKQHTIYLCLMSIMTVLFLWFGLTTEGRISTAALIWAGILMGHVSTELLNNYVGEDCDD